MTSYSFGWYFCLATTFGKFQLRSEGSLSMLANMNDTTNRRQRAREKLICSFTV